MKFLKKPALANTNTIPSGAFSHNHSPDFAYTNAFLSLCVCSLEKLTDRLNRYSLIRKKNHLLKKALNLSYQKGVNARAAIPIRSSHTIGWAPLIKTAAPAKNCVVSNRVNHGSNYPLAGRSILCVGGRIKLYPEYNQLIENSGGNLMTFHGNSNDHLDNLPRLLEKADMIVCPIDCVNHQAFFIVKYYCLYSDKPCVLLDRSEVNTFCIGINMLVTLTTGKVSNEQN